jgi:phosphatidylserine/phosphatidylglycerophosphate/cardiolipin synthase-like enzyme
VPDRSSSQIALSTKELGELARAIDRNLIRDQLGEETLAAAGLSHLGRRLGPLTGLHPALARDLINALVAERQNRQGDAVHLVWTGPEAISGTARDTAAVVRELFHRARHSVLIAGYAFDHGAEIFEPLHASMQRHQLDVRLFVDIPRQPAGQKAADHVRAWTDRFLLENWCFPRRPTLYFDPRAVTHDAYASLHAKCIVVDERLALVTSANFTDRGQGRNIEVGVLVEDPTFGRSLAGQWLSALAAEVFVSIDDFLGANSPPEDQTDWGCRRNSGD